MPQEHTQYLQQIVNVNLKIDHVWIVQHHILLSISNINENLKNCDFDANFKNCLFCAHGPVCKMNKWNV